MTAVLPKTPTRIRLSNIVRTSIGLAAQFDQDLLGNQSESQPNAQRNKDKVIQISENRNEIRYEVDRTQGIGGNGGKQPFRGTRNPFVGKSKTQDTRFPPGFPGGFLKPRFCFSRRHKRIVPPSRNDVDT